MTRVHTYTEQRPGYGLSLTLHHHAPAADPRATIVILHGFLDAGITFGAVAQQLAERGYHVIAPDQRGFGDSERVSGGGYYHFPNYLADVDALVRTLGDSPLLLVGHSMGGTVATMYAGTRPERLAGLALLEGLGPPIMPPELALTRTCTWLDQLATPKTPRGLKDKDDALRRLSIYHPTVPEPTLRHIVELLTRTQDQQLSWSYDPLHRTTAPVPFHIDSFKAFLGNYQLPHTHRRRRAGPPAGTHRTRKIASLPFPRLPTVSNWRGAGHMMHWTQPNALSEHLAEVRGRGVCASADAQEADTPGVGTREVITPAD